MVERETVENFFSQQFKTDMGACYMAPGRVNLIGEHTDYNDGFVFPGAIDKGITAKINPNGLKIVRAYSIDLKEYLEFNIDSAQLPTATWARYIYGVCKEIMAKGIAIDGFDTAFAGDIPLGAGMSSSAALESCYAFALNDIFGNNQLPKMDLALIGQKTEHQYVGVNCGIMDQFASVFGKEGYLMRLDCQSMEYEYFPFNPEKYGYRVVLVDSVVKHELVNSPYNQRRKSCERVSATLGVKSLRAAEINDLDKIKNDIDILDYNRAKYVIEEKQRVLDVCKALQENNYELVGELMYQTHKGLSVYYEVSCAELDFINITAKYKDVTGSRMMGGGFGGCVINIVKADLYNEFIETVLAMYTAKFGHSPKIYDVIISDGARKLN